MGWSLKVHSDIWPILRINLDKKPTILNVRQVTSNIRHLTLNIRKTTPISVANKTLQKIYHRHKSPGRRNRLAYIRRHISTSGNAQFDDELAQLESMEKCFLHTDNQVRKTNHFSTETLISGHNCSNRMRATPYFHFQFGAKYRQTCTA